MPITHEYHGNKFFVHQQGRLFATPLFVVLLIVDLTDLVFAVDSVPAVLAITLDSFIAYSSNIFAILGLRALYFVLAGAMELFHCLKYGLSFILVFVGVKMLLSDMYHISAGLALGVIAATLCASIAASFILPHPSKGLKS